MSTETSRPSANKGRPRLALALFLLLSLVMYTSIMYKIINYGP